MKSRDVIKKLEAAGWVKVASKGSHHHYKLDGEGKRVTVPHPKKHLPIGTRKSIEAATGIKLT